MTVGQGQFSYDLDENWGKMPNGDRVRYVSSIACDAEDRVYAFCRAGEAVRIFDQVGALITAWGEGRFLRPHGIGLSPDGLIYCADDKAHVVHSFTFDGELVRTWGKSGQRRVTEFDGRLTPETEGPMFNAPTDITFSADGTMYIADGYGNSELHRFDRNGRWTRSWGAPGSNPGQFKTVHAACLDSKGRVIVADRSNDRLQVFSPDGDLLQVIPEVVHPNAIQCDRNDFIYSTGKGQVDIRTPEGELVCRWGRRCVDDRIKPSEILHRAHGLAVDSLGNLYLGDEMHDHGGFLRKYRLRS
ncbi:hypothetical protein [Ensifer sp. YR511]|uniref:hypothetical protein n=1 Tax=Ensifer sp. YR511 TaxID=1855294 RepID=UPI00087FD855|nr:hypothetical protein [Ensifer sp. YR511]SDN73259.1 NHL repeat-containing protein [Ensifer sp. YR511]